MKKRLLSLALCLVMLLSLMPTTAFAADTGYLRLLNSDGTPAPSDAYLNYSTVLCITGSGSYILEMDAGTVTSRGVSIESTGDLELTLRNVNIDRSAESSGTAPDTLAIEGCAGNVTIVLEGSNSLKSGSGRAGLAKMTGNDKSLTIKGTGSLTANGGTGAAGIGGGDYYHGSNITISGGTVIANGGTDAAGIGGGRQGSGSNITITGGSVTATAGTYSGANSPPAAIGRGYNGSSSENKVVAPEGQYASIQRADGTSVSIAEADISGYTDRNLSVSFSSCAPHSVQFDMQGHGTQVNNQTVNTGRLVAQPSDPSADGWFFDGWYKEPACTTAWDFANDVVTQDMILYAKWIQSYSVDFNVQGHGVAPADAKSDKNGKITKSTDLSEEGWLFCGWYKEAACTTAWDFASDVVTQDMTLYAKWLQTGLPVHFDVQGHGAAPTDAESDINGKIAKPTDPSANGLVFTGWYQEPECTNVWDFANDVVTKEMTLYAKWIPLTAGGSIQFISAQSFSLSTNENRKSWDGELQYSTNGTNWSVWDGATAISAVENSDNYYALYLCGTGNSVITGQDGMSNNFVLSGTNISCSGNIENLLDYTAVTNGSHPTMGDF